MPVPDWTWFDVVALPVTVAWIHLASIQLDGRPQALAGGLVLVIIAIWHGHRWLQDVDHGGRARDPE